MNDINSIRELVGKTIKRLYLIVWPPPPFGEEHMSQVDLSIGFSFNLDDNEICVISTSMDDVWTPTFRLEYPKLVYESRDFFHRINKWMNCELEDDFDYEFYDVTD
jgi:hypothetical protein